MQGGHGGAGAQRQEVGEDHLHGIFMGGSLQVPEGGYDVFLDYFLGNSGFGLCRRFEFQRPFLDRGLGVRHSQVNFHAGYPAALVVDVDCWRPCGSEMAQ